MDEKQPFRFSDRTRKRLLKCLRIGLRAIGHDHSLVLGILDKLEGRIARALAQSQARLQKVPGPTAEHRAFVLLQALTAELGRADCRLTPSPAFRSELERMISVLTFQTKLANWGKRRGRRRDATRAAVEYATLYTLQECGMDTGGLNAARALAAVLEDALSLRLKGDPENENIKRALMRTRKALAPFPLK